MSQRDYILIPPGEEAELDFATRAGKKRGETSLFLSLLSLSHFPFEIGIPRTALSLFFPFRFFFFSLTSSSWPVNADGGGGWRKRFTGRVGGEKRWISSVWFLYFYFFFRKCYGKRVKLGSEDGFFFLEGGMYVWYVRCSSGSVPMCGQHSSKKRAVVGGGSYALFWEGGTYQDCSKQVVHRVYW